MTAPHFVTTHARQRSKERVPDLDLDKTVANLPSLIAGSIYLSAKETGANQQEQYRLLYAKDIDAFVVLVVKTDIEKNLAVLHTIVTVYTVEMYESNTKKVVSDKDYSKAARTVMGPVEFRNWSKEKFTRNPLKYSNRLFVWFSKNGKPYQIKVTRFACAEFRKNSNPYDILIHPGVITGVNQQLQRFRRCLNERLYMRLDGQDGLLSLLGKKAQKCPYCGMNPLDTDTSADRSEISE